MLINTNISLLKNQNFMRNTNKELQKNLEKLVSGYSINSAADDAAGLAISEKMKALISELNRCDINISEGINLTQTADGAMAEVNDMLIRAQELSISAANGTLSEKEKNIIADEINSIYDELDRIFKGSNFNKLKLFQGTELYTHYDESVNVNPAGTLESWGAINGMPYGEFDLAVPAKGGSVTMTFDDDIDINRASTLAGKQFYLNGYTYSFTSGSGSDSYRNINVSGLTTVQQAIDKLSDRTLNPSYHLNPLDKEKTIVTQEGGKTLVTFTFKPRNLNEITNGIGFEIPNANGQVTNGISISSSDGLSLGAVDSLSNATIYDSTATTTSFKFMSNHNSTSSLMNNEINNLVKNTLVVGSNTIGFTTTGESGKIDISNITVADLRVAINGKIDAFQNYTSNIDSNGNMSVSVKNLSTNTTSSISIYESNRSAYYTNGDIVNVGSLNITTQMKQSSNNERVDKHEITIPNPLPSTDFAFNINGYSYLFYDETKAYPNFSYNTNYRWGMKGKTPDDIKNYIKDRVKYHTSNANVTLVDNKIIVEGTKANKPTNINVKGTTAKITERVYNSGSSVVLNLSRQYFRRGYSTPINLKECMGNTFDVSKLTKKGFSYDSNWYEFTNGSNTPTYPGARVFNIKGCKNFEDIRAIMENVMGTDVSMETDGTVKINKENKYTYNSPSFSDGYKGSDGLFTNSGSSVSEKTQGGINAAKPQFSLDFSQYKHEDLIEKGFRINCASCEGEFINIFFCNDKESIDFPLEFDMLDNSQTPPVTVTIKNYAVELKTSTTAESIVENIVSQLKEDLDHYTEVSIGNPNTVLLINDKRTGDLGPTQRGKIERGVYTNFTYNATYVERRLPPPILPGDDVGYKLTDIFVGSHPNIQKIPIHLPYLSLETLNLRPPKLNLEDPDNAMKTAEKHKKVNDIIVSCRTRIGADQNRLEHAQNNIKNSAIQATNSFSRIRDADMAKEMAENMKLKILKESQNSLYQQARTQSQHLMDMLLNIGK